MKVLLRVTQNVLKITGIVGRISPKTWAAMEIFLASIATEEYDSMASSLIEMGATNKDIATKAFARDLEKIFSSIQARTVNYPHVQLMSIESLLQNYYVHKIVGS